MEIIKRLTKTTLNSVPGFNNYFIWHGRGHTNKIALTFDDGPISGNTEKILNILSDFNSFATFFLIGDQLKRNPDLGNLIKKEGHCIGSHSYSHQQLNLLRKEAAVSEIINGIKEIREIIGNDSLKWFRPPKGDLQWRLIPFLIKENIRTVFWNVDPQDYLLQCPDELFSYLTKHDYKGGEIVLLHDKIETTVNVLPKYLKYMQDINFQFVTIPELLS